MARPKKKKRKPPLKRQTLKILMKCRICEETIASFYPKNVERPLKSEMFDPIDPTYVKPFFDNVFWVDFMCPYCRNQPFWVTEEVAQEWDGGKGKGPNEILTDLGIYHVDEKKAFTSAGESVEIKSIWVCDECGKEFEKRNSLAAHKNVHSNKKQTPKERAINE